MCKKMCVILAFIITVFSLFALDKADDAFNEIETGELSIYFFNALNGEPIVNGDVLLDGIGTQKTDHHGKITFLPQEDEYIQTIVFKADKYIQSTFDVEINAGTLFFNRFSVSPVMDINYFRVVLDWDKKPNDLDAHFEKKGAYHISYRNTRTLSDGRGQLDRDDTNGYGPETITVTRVEQDGMYEFFVEDYSNRSDRNSSALSKSKACVKVYGNGQLLNVIKIPKKQKGNIWRVFKVENGKVISINSVE
ncbi:MAG TPA: hypothetical protein PKJ08_12195 [Candidatus Cloacimonadota bacterium]|nr:hypothetical protein [Candidatus Cloacimonadota bacterium]